MLVSKKFNILLVIYSVLFIPNIAFSNAHIGIEGAYSRVVFHKGYGDNAFRKFASGINVFANYMVTDYLGAEIGYEFFKKTNKTVTVYTNEMFVGTTVNPPTLFESYRSSMNHRNHYFGFKGKVNIIDSSNFLSLLLGIAEFHIKSKYNLFADDAGPLDLTRTFIKNKPIFLLKASAEKSINNKLSLTATVSWKNTNRIKITSEENGSGGPSELKLKNNLTASIGISYLIT